MIVLRLVHAQTPLTPPSVILPNLHPSPFCTALGPLFLPPYDLSSSSFILLKWENDGRTMGELRTKERRKSDRTYIDHQDGKQDKTVIISLSTSYVTILPLNGLHWRTAYPDDRFGLNNRRTPLQRTKNFQPKQMGNKKNHGFQNPESMIQYEACAAISRRFLSVSQRFQPTEGHQ